MKGKLSLILVSSAALMILLATAAEWLYFSDFEYHLRSRRFNRILAEKEAITDQCLDILKSKIEKGESISSAARSELIRTIKEQEITLLEYLDNKLVYWSDNSFDIPSVYDDSLFNRPLDFIHNGWFITRTIGSGNEKIIALLRISNDYGFENDIVRSGFVRSFRVPEGTLISFDREASPFTITGRNGEYLFSLVFPSVKQPSPFIILPWFLWVLVFLMILILANEVAKLLVKNNKPVLALVSSLLIGIVVYIVILLFKKPAIFFHTDLFSPYRFSLNNIVPTLGHLFVLSILTLLPSWIFLRYFPLKIKETGGLKSLMVLTLLFCDGSAAIAIYHNVFVQLIVDSNINLQPFKVLDLSLYSFIGFISMIFLLSFPSFYLYRIIKDSVNVPVTVFAVSMILSSAVFIVLSRNGFADTIPVVVFYILLIVFARLTFKYSIGRFNTTVIFSVLFGFYSVYCIVELSQKKNIENKKVLAVAYSTEHDPEAEHLLLNLWSELSIDSTLKNILTKDQLLQNDIDNITTYLHERYFNGYWGNFNLSVVTCSNDSPLWISSEETLVDNCFEFFSERLKKYGHQLTGTGFWFLDNQGGRSYYMGQLFFDLGNNRKNGLFIELYSDIDAFQAGYSELLLDKKYQGYMKLRDYSFAKYINGNLVLRTGDFPYDKTDAQYVGKEYDYRLFSREKYNHVLYKNGNVTVMISEKRLSADDVIINFAYLFAFILLVSNLLLAVLIRPDLKSMLSFNFRQKLQLSFIAILMFSFISVGVVVAFFSIRQYESRHLENIKEKINSIYTELENKLGMESDLSPDWRDGSYPSLNELLISLSNIFNTDINLFDTKGYLMATSRPEVFFRDLTGRRLNMDAFINLENLTKSEYIQSEKIASLEFVSAYVPFYNSSDKLLAYLNLPYFRMQSVLARDISNVIVAVVNFTLLLVVITMFIVVIISGRLTSPLRMLSEGMSKVELGKKSEHLSYAGQDEISDIVKQYNRMVDELQESARKLAMSEREFAWREMAKQVAHEIKNPLTPMKLNIQQLFKSWKDGIPGFERKLENFTKNQIEYIDTLSSIASAFSSFAKMPAANPSNVDLIDQIRTTLELFKNEENISFRTDWPTTIRIIVNADKEHLNGIFSNLIKNAIQSVPQTRSGLIKIKIEVAGNRVVISIEDNGTGIPDDLKKNLFTPNFTTKSSGAGLGLSIVKRYAETANGNVWFESEEGKGSCFFVELPVIYTVERLG
jgi:signal transduction histidine kinase